MRAEEMMTRHVHTCSKDDSLEQAAGIMWESNVGSVVVTDGEQHPIGMLTDRDIAMAAYTQGRRLADTQVSTAMARELKSCAPGASLGELEALMQAAQVRRIPVIDAKGRLLGIVTLGDLAKHAQSSPLHLPSVPGVAKTLAAISELRVPTAMAAQ